MQERKEGIKEDLKRIEVFLVALVVEDAWNGAQIA